MQPPTPPTPPRSTRSLRPVPRSSSSISGSGVAQPGTPSISAHPTGPEPGLSERAASGQHESLVGRTLGKYRLMSLLGEGGMGAVYRSEDPIIRRPVAVKVLSRAVSADPEGQQRFLREARAAGRVIHPNIVAVFDVGQQEGRWYLVMELVTGGSAADYLRRKGPFPWPEALRIVADSCRGLAAAHSSGLIHRDIKPANIMRAADGTVKLADFGLAKLADSLDCGLTQAGAVVGTPYFMSPEQCHGLPIDHRSDLYSLGATLFTLLVGQPPFTQGSAQQVMFAQCYQPVPDPRKICPGLSGMPEGLLTVLNRAMAKQPPDRYRHADEMLADLLAVAAGQALAPGGPNAQQDGSAWNSQSGIGPSKSASGAHRLAAKAESSSERSPQSPSLGLSPSPSRSDRLTRRESGSSGGAGPFRAQQPSLDAAFQSPTLATSQLAPGGNNAETVAGITAVQAPERRLELMAGLVGGAVALLIVGVGLAIVLGRSDGDSPPDDASVPAAMTKPVTISVHPTPSGPPKPTAWCDVANVFATDNRNSHEGSATAVRYSPDGRCLATCGIDRTVRVWSIPVLPETAARFRWSLAHHRNRVTGLAFSPDRATLLSSSADAQVILWDVNEGQLRHSFSDIHQGDRPQFGKPQRGDEIRAVACSTDGRRYFTIGRDGYIMSWDFKGMLIDRVRYGPRGEIDTDGNYYFESLAVSRDPCYLVLCLRRHIVIVDAQTLKILHTTDILHAAMTAVGVTPDAGHIVAGDKDGTLVRWAMVSSPGGLLLKLLHPWIPQAHSGIVSGLAFSPDGAVLASAGFDSQLRFWDFRSGMTPLARVTAHGKPLMAVDFRADGWQVATVAQDGLLKLWQPAR